MSNSDIPKRCPKCGREPFVTFMRGTIARLERSLPNPFKKRPKWAIICNSCRETIGYEWEKITDLFGTGHLEMTLEEKKEADRHKGASGEFISGIRHISSISRTGD
jgi:hypothetical protein